jgi:hypothetical protein
MGHNSPRAALIYLHTSSERDRVVARSLNELVNKHQKRQRRKAENQESQRSTGGRAGTGTQRARSQEQDRSEGDRVSVDLAADVQRW